MKKASPIEKTLYIRPLRLHKAGDMIKVIVVFFGGVYLSPVNSHIQVPFLILKNFVNDKCKVNYIDLYNNVIDSKGPRQLGTKYGYYLQENETYLDEKVESPFGNVSSMLKKFQNAEFEPIKITSDFEQITKRFLYFSILRSEYLKTLYEKTSFTYSDGDRAQDILVDFGKNSKAPEMPYDNYKLNLLINSTQLGFVALRNCWYLVPQNGHETIVMPIAPKVAVILMHPQDRALHEKGKNLEYANIESEDEIMTLNESALQFEYILNRAFVAGNDNTELKRLQEILRREKDNYEVERRNLIDE